MASHSCPLSHSHPYSRIHDQSFHSHPHFISALTFTPFDSLLYTCTLRFTPTLKHRDTAYPISPSNNLHTHTGTLMPVYFRLLPTPTLVHTQSHTCSHSCSPLNAQTLSYSHVHSILHPTLQILHISAFAPNLAHSDSHDYDHTSAGTSTFTCSCTLVSICSYSLILTPTVVHLLLSTLTFHITLKVMSLLLHTLAQSHSYTHTHTLHLTFTLTHTNFCMHAHSYNHSQLTDSCDPSCTLMCHTRPHSQANISPLSSTP